MLIGRCCAHFDVWNHLLSYLRMPASSMLRKDCMRGFLHCNVRTQQTQPLASSVSYVWEAMSSISRHYVELNGSAPKLSVIVKTKTGVVGSRLVTFEDPHHQPYHTPDTTDLTSPSYSVLSAHHPLSSTAADPAVALIEPH